MECGTNQGLLPDVTGCPETNHDHEKKKTSKRRGPRLLLQLLFLQLLTPLGLEHGGMSTLRSLDERGQFWAFAHQDTRSVFCPPSQFESKESMFQTTPCARRCPRTVPFSSSLLSALWTSEKGLVRRMKRSFWRSRHMRKNSSQKRHMRFSQGSRPSRFRAFNMDPFTENGSARK